MKLSSNFINFHNEFGLKKTIDIFSAAGFEAIDFNADLKEYYTNAHDEAFYKDAKAYALEKGIVFAQTHAPFAVSFEDSAQTKQRFAEIVKSMQHSAWLGAEMTVVHACKHLPCDTEENRQKMLEANLDFYRSLIPYAEEFGIQIAIENLKNSVTETADGLLALLHELNNPVFTVCYAVGHAKISGQDPAEMIRALGTTIGCTHIHDNDGVADSHTLPYYGVIDWDGVMKAFAEAGYTGNLNYEAGHFVRNVPLSLRPQGAVYMAEVGKQLIERYWAYKKIGAGC